MAAGLVVATAAAGYVVVVGSASTPVVFITLGDIWGRILEAGGFIFVFTGIASMLRVNL